MPKCFQPYDFILSKSHKLYFSSLPQNTKDLRGTCFKEKFNMPTVTLRKQKKANFILKNHQIKNYLAYLSVYK